MQPTSSKSSALSRLAARVFALVAGPRSPLQRARNFVLRPVRHELLDLGRELDPLRLELAGLTARERARAEDNARLLQAIAALEAQLRATSSAADEERGSIHAQLHTIYSQLHSVHAQLESVHPQLQSMHGQLQSTQGELQSTQGQLQSTQGQLQSTQGQLQSTQDQLQSTQDQLQSAHGELHSTQGQLQSTQGELHSMQGELQSTQGHLKSAQAHLQTLDTDLQARRRHGALLERLLVSAHQPAPPRLAHVAGRPVRASIVLPTRNRAAFVAEAIRSVQDQAFDDWELIVVDDGSTDDTRAVVSRFLDDARIRLESIEHAGASAARNHGMGLARGEFFAYIDSDNLWFPGFLAAAIAALDAEPGLDLVYGALVTESHGLADGCLLLQDFDRPRLLQGNYIDLNTVVHRRTLYAEQGGFDEDLDRLVDWDLLLRYTDGAAARALPVLAARYRVCDAIRITDNVPLGPNWLAVRKRADPVAVSSRRPRILYVVWHYPQLSETYLEGEIRCMRRWGVEIEVWRQVLPASSYESSVPVHDGELAEAVRRFHPDAIHVHWMSFALSQGDALAALELPVTLRMHGFDVTSSEFGRLLEQPWLHRVYAFPAQLRLLPAPDARVVPMAAAFDSSLFRPSANKDRRLVVRAGSCLPSKDIPAFFELARRLPGHRFVFAGVTCNGFEHYPEQLRQLAAETGSPVELCFDLPHEQMAALLGLAGIYLHTVNRPDAAFAAPIGMPISIAEAMASGAYVLVRDLPELAAYVGTAGATYSDLDEAERLIAETAGWSDAQWSAVRIRASDRGFLEHADELVLRPLYEDWCRLAAASGPDATEPASAPAVSRLTRPA